jgi:hypothetical protein
MSRHDTGVVQSTLCWKIISISRGCATGELAKEKRGWAGYDYYINKLLVYSSPIEALEATREVPD